MRALIILGIAFCILGGLMMLSGMAILVLEIGYDYDFKISELWTERLIGWGFGAMVMGFLIYFFLEMIGCEIEL